MMIFSGCTGSKLSPPADHAGSDVAWTSFRGNSPASTGIAGEVISPPLAVLWEFEAYGARPGMQGEVDIPDTAAPPDRRAAFRSSPVSSDGIVVAGSMDGAVYGVVAETGEEAWRFETGDAVIASPLIAGANVYIGSMNGNFYCLDLETGEQKMKFTASRGIKGAAATDGRIIYFGALDRSLYALDIDTFAPAVKAPPQADQLPGGDNDPYENILEEQEPGTGGEDAAAAMNQKQDALSALNKLPGQHKNGVVFQALDWIEGAPAVVEGRIYVGANDGFLYVLDAASGDVLWSYETANCVYSTPAIAHGVVFFTSWDGHVYALDALDGSLKWKTRIDEQVSASPAVKDGIVVVGGAFDGDLAGLDAVTGEVLWRVPTKGGFDAGPVISGDIAYAGSYDDHLYAVDITDGTVVWKKLMKHMMRGSVALANNTVFAGTGAGKLFALVEPE